MKDIEYTAWRKSSHSNASGNCVEVAVTDASIRVRDSKQRGRGPVLEFSPADWAAFLRLANDGDLGL